MPDMKVGHTSMYADKVLAVQTHAQDQHNVTTSLELLPELADAHILVRVLLHDLSDSHLKVLLGHMHPPLTQRKHSRLRAARLAMATQFAASARCL